MDRRKFAAIVCAALAAPCSLHAQPAKRVYRIAILDDAVESSRAAYWKLFRNRLRELGRVEGRDVIYEARYARADTEKLPSLVSELLALKPDIIACVGTPASSAAMKATSSIPIVFIGPADPVGTGLVASLARPGGNVTGTSNITAQLAGKLIELVREMSPAATRLAFLADASNKGAEATFRQMLAAARAINMTVRMLDGRKQPDLERSFGTIKREGIQGLVVSTTLFEHRDLIVRFAAQEKLPAVYGRRDYVDAGGLLSYSADYQWLFVRGAEFVDRILKGTKPAELPVEQSSRFLMVLNLKTARTLGIKIPDVVRLGADEVIQ